MSRSQKSFRVRRLRQERARCLADEFMAVGLPRRCCVHEREVLLECDDDALVFAHTIVPLQATSSDWPFFHILGERSLGSTLFGDPRVIRGAMQYARLNARHPLVRRVCNVLALASMERPLYARRCLYRRKNGMLLVTEVFLPAMNRLLPGNAQEKVA